MTTKMEERYEGQFLDALDLPEGREVAVTIEGVVDPFVEKDAAGKIIKNAILAFKGKTKRLGLNKTNFKNLKAQFGKESKDWLGKQIKLQRRYLDAAHGFGVNNTLAIRIIPPVGTPILRSAANFMGQPHPYGQPAAKPHRENKPTQPPAQDPAPDPPALSAEDKATLKEWVDIVSALQSEAECQQLRADLATCPAGILSHVERALRFTESRLQGAAT